MREFRDYVSKLNLCSSHKNYILNLVKRIFAHSSIYFDNLNNSTNVLYGFKTTQNEKIQNEMHKDAYLTLNEFSQFIKYVNDDYRLFFELLYFSGMRLGEIQALKWADFQKGKLSINKAFNKQTNSISSTKTLNSIRTIDLRTKLSNELQTAK